MKMTIVLLVSLLLSASTLAQDLKLTPPELLDEQQSGWFQKPNGVDVALQVTFTTLIMVDWLQTSSFTRNPNWPGYETNWVMGPHPSLRMVNIYQASVIVGSALIAYALPRPWRNIWQTFSIGIEVYAIGGNLRLGTGFRVPW